MMWAKKDPEKIKDSVIRPRRGSLKGNEVRGMPKFFFLLYLCAMHKCVLMVDAKCECSHWVHCQEPNRITKILNGFQDFSFLLSP